jgi:hypothetical protein
MREPDLRRCAETGLRIDDSRPPLDALVWEAFLLDCPRFATRHTAIPTPLLPWQLPEGTDPAVAAWYLYRYAQLYVALVREVVSPAIRSLDAEGLITWFHLLVHSYEEGAPTIHGDPYDYVHVRMCRAPGISERLLQERLAGWLPVRSIPVENMTALVRGQHALGDEAAPAWLSLGHQTSAFLSFLDANHADRPIPIRRLLQHLHYPDSMTMRMCVTCAQRAEQTW